MLLNQKHFGARALKVLLGLDKEKRYMCVPTAISTSAEH